MSRKRNDKDREREEDVSLPMKSQNRIEICLRIKAIHVQIRSTTQPCDHACSSNTHLIRDAPFLNSARRLFV